MNEPTNVRYVTVRRPMPKPGDMPDYEIQLYQQLPVGITLDRTVGSHTPDALFGVLIVDDAFEVSAHEWLEGKRRRFGWSFTWHDSHAAAEVALHDREAAER